MTMTRRTIATALWAALVMGLAGPAAATPLVRDVIMMDWAGALGGTLLISANGGGSFENVYAGPYQFNVFEAVRNGDQVSKGAEIARLIGMFCDSASYDLLNSAAYVELSGNDLQNGYGRLYAHAPAATAKETYQHASWALSYASLRGTADWYRAAQAYMWELWSDAVNGNAFDLASGSFQVASSDRTPTLMNEVGFLVANARTDMMASLDVPVTLATGSTARYTTTLSGVTSDFRDSESSQEMLTTPVARIAEPNSLGLVATAGAASWRTGGCGADACTRATTTRRSDRRPERAASQRVQSDPFGGWPGGPCATCGSDA
jgi:hypothetical protein